MKFKTHFQKHLTSELLVPTFLGCATFVLCSSVVNTLIKHNGYDDNVRLIYKLIEFFIILSLGGLLKTYLYFVIGRKEGLIGEDSYIGFLSGKFLEWIVVEVRAQLRVLLFSLLLIIPGIIEGLRLSLATPLVFFSPKMKDDTFDPIQSSRKSLDFNQSKILILLLAISTGAFLTAITFSSANYFEGVSGFLLATLNALFQTFFTYLTYTYTTYLYLYFYEEETA